nr:copia protein [Tanacetum cinerariifolium]
MTITLLKTRLTKDSQIVKAKRERKYLALKAKKESSDDECSNSESEDKEYTMAVRDFKKFIKRRGDRKCFRCGDPNHLIGECPKPPKDKNQRAFVRGSWSDSGEEDDEKIKDETCLIAQASNKTSPLVDDDLYEEEEIKVAEKKILENDIEDETLKIDEVVNIKKSRSHPLENVIGNHNQRTLRNKLDENGVVSRNKARLVAQGYNQQEGIDYDETYVPVARLESIRILLAYACALDFKLFQIDIKSSFLKGFINEEARYHVSVCLCARFQKAPKTSHLEAVRRIFRYIKGNMHLGLWYPKGTGIETVVYADSNHAGDYVDRKSTSG